MNDNDLSDAFRAAVPPRPDTREWAEGARRKARRRRVGGTFAALLLVAAMATPLAFNLPGRSTVLATPSPTATATRLVPDICKDPVPSASPLVDGDLPDGATRVWLCGRSDTGSELELVGLPDPLVEGAGQAVAAFNALEKSEGVLDCLPNPLDYTVVVEYPDDVHRALRVAGCGDLRDATGMFDIFRADGAGYLAELQALWAAERAQTEFAFTGADVCDASYSSVLRPIEADDLARAVACGADGSAAELEEDLTSDILAELTAGTSVTGGDALWGAPLPDLVLLTATGDPVALHRESEGVYWWDDGYARFRWGLIDPALEARILEAQGPDGGPMPTGTPMPSLPEEPRVGLVSQVCDDIQSGRIAAEDLPDTEEVPQGATRAWLCGDRWETFGGVGPLEPLTTDPDRVAAAINALPSPDYEACTEMGGITYHVVLDYPDGDRRIVSAETVNCEWVGGWGNRAGGAQLLQDLLPLWAAQREAEPEPFVEEVDVCSDTAALVGLNALGTVERGSLYRGVVCGKPADAADGEDWIQRELPGDLVLAISQAQPVPDQSGVFTQGGAYLVLMNQFGDPVTYAVTQPAGESPQIRTWEWVWAPGADLMPLWVETLAGLRLE
ncbi:hypothetical protein BCR15_07600 [Tessaracoccus lapidicaptus]|uniref:Uncharacterized protein n=1 Tax=Tessaracoccus lapidicaptus TaxID=1427523 RepID=A0A1C0AII7_9ACTN|nr:MULTISPECIES: hypothetical protein [Tessaracoccus]AQX15632.1 hypothetical protein BKM78_06685 [Tessaracoccus sp. T2.5-30]OCL31914.1 hypothetical protein BCR15_07600 [Tessaracoccus lapidicaptus]VEP40008.1 hypothetical protein TLA_TLA_01351 [Tessaracoccus lapidicaptus]